MKPLQIGGVDDHIHLLLGASGTMAPAKAAHLIKGGSSAWIHTEFPQLRKFAWQDGYGAFTVSKSNVPDVTAYIQNQREHYLAKSFKVEFLSLLQRHEIDYEIFECLHGKHWRCLMSQTPKRRIHRDAVATSSLWQSPQYLLEFCRNAFTASKSCGQTCGERTIHRTRRCASQQPSEYQS